MEKLYTYPAYIRAMGRIIIVLSFIIWVIVGIITIIDKSKPIDMFLFITICSAAFGSLGFVIIHFNEEKIELSQKGITFIKRRKKRFISFADIKSVSHSSKVYTAIILHTDSEKYVIRKNLICYPEFLENLKMQVKVLQQDLGKVITVKCKAWETYICAGIFILLGLAFWIISIVAAATGETSIGTTIFISIILLPFVIGLTILSLTYPRQYTFEKSKIIKIYLSGRKEFGASQITGVQYGQKKPKTYTRFGSQVLHFIEFTFADKKKYIHLDQTMTDYPINEIADFAKEKYPIEGIFTEVFYKK